jgi:hypothetical protein
MYSFEMITLNHADDMVIMTAHNRRAISTTKRTKASMNVIFISARVITFSMPAAMLQLGRKGGSIEEGIER